MEGLPIVNDRTCTSPDTAPPNAANAADAPDEADEAPPRPKHWKEYREPWLHGGGEKCLSVPVIETIVERKHLPLGGAPTLVLAKIKYPEDKGSARTPLVALVVDVSPSMEYAQLIPMLKDSLRAVVLGSLRAIGARVAMWTFSTRYDRISGEGWLDLGTAEGVAEMLGHIDSVQADMFGSTDIGSVTIEATNKLCKTLDALGDCEGCGLVVVMTDGNPTVGPYSLASSGPVLGSLVRAAIGARSVAVSTIALGPNPDADYMKAFTTGPYAAAPTKEQLLSAYEVIGEAAAAKHNMSLVVADELGCALHPIGSIPRSGTELLFGVEPFRRDSAGEHVSFGLAVCRGPLLGTKCVSWSCERSSYTDDDLPAETRPDEISDAMERDHQAKEIVRAIGLTPERGVKATLAHLRSIEASAKAEGPKRARTVALVGEALGRFRQRTAGLECEEAPLPSFRSCSHVAAEVDSLMISSSQRFG